jgi:hypothetical protein
MIGKSRATRPIVADSSLTALEQTSMLVCRGEVREFGLTGLTRNQVSLTAPGVRIPPSPPTSLHIQRFAAEFAENPRILGTICISRGTGDRRGAASPAKFRQLVSVSIFAGAARKTPHQTSTPGGRTIRSCALQTSRSSRSLLKSWSYDWHPGCHSVMLR